MTGVGPEQAVGDPADAALLRASGAPAADDAFAAGMGMGIVTGAARPVRLATPVNAAAARLFPVGQV